MCWKNRRIAINVQTEEQLFENIVGKEGELAIEENRLKRGRRSKKVNLY